MAAVDNGDQPKASLLTQAVWALGGPLFLTLHTSVIQSVAVLKVCSIAATGCSGGDIYSISLGFISAIVIFIYGFMFKCFEDIMIILG
jgi:hypothetical protein